MEKIRAKFGSTPVAFLLVIIYPITGFISAFSKVFEHEITFPDIWLNNMSVAFWVGCTSFLPEVIFRLIDIYLKLKGKDIDVPNTIIGFKPKQD